MSDKQTNYILWKKIKKLSTGDISSKIKAVDVAIANFRIFPQSFSLIKELANKTQPSEVRIRVAMKMREAPLKVKEHYELMKILFQNADKELLENLRLLNMSSLINYNLLRDINPAKTINDVVQLQSKFLRDINPAKTINDAVQQQMRLFKDINPSKAINDAVQQQMRLFRDITRIELSNYLQSPRWSLLTNDYIKTAKPYVSFLDVNKKLTLPFRNQLNKSVGYYSKEELEPIKTPPQVRRDSKASTLLAELEQCELGKKHWKRYQDICKEILCYCLVPPLQEPFEQSETRDGLHIRDLIFGIPFDLNGFWTFIIVKFGLFMVFECKNYKDTIKENQLRISLKYIGREKPSRLGVIVTRKGLHKNGIIAQENIWKAEGNMILCMSDEQLKKMLQLKDEGDEPWKVIDGLMRNFLLSVS